MSLQNVWNVTSENLRYGTERKVGVNLRRGLTLAMHNKQILKTAIVGLFLILSAVFLPNIIWLKNLLLSQM